MSAILRAPKTLPPTFRRWRKTKPSMSRISNGRNGHFPKNGKNSNGSHLSAGGVVPPTLSPESRFVGAVLLTINRKEFSNTALAKNGSARALQRKDRTGKTPGSMVKRAGRFSAEERGWPAKKKSYVRNSSSRRRLHRSDRGHRGQRVMTAGTMKRRRFGKMDMRHGRWPEQSWPSLFWPLSSIVFVPVENTCSAGVCWVIDRGSIQGVVTEARIRGFLRRN